MTFPTCVHCGVDIALVNYALGPKWMHNPYPRRFDEEYWACRNGTVATPVFEGVNA